MNEYYILDGHEPVPASKEEWEAGMKDQKAATAEGHQGLWTVADTRFGRETGQDGIHRSQVSERISKSSLFLDASGLRGTNRAG